MPTNTYVALATQTLSSSAASVTFSSIPQGYTDLVLVATAIRGGTPGSGAANYNLTFNGDTGSNYSATLLYEAPAGDRQTNATSIGYSGAVGDNHRMQNATHIMNYANTTTYKTILGRWGSAESAQARASAGLWRNTAAITSFTITPSLGVAAGSTFTLYGIAATSVGAKATGGDIYSDSSYYYHVFDASGTFTPTQSISADVLVVAGGGGGAAGGGGAGGIFYATAQSLTATGYTCTVGAGGNGGSGGNPGGYFSATSGANSSFGALTAAVGGGYGAMIGNNGQTAGANGGSGGAGGAYSSATTTGGLSTQTSTGGTGYGNAGGGNGGYLGDPYPSGGGGGAGGVGSNAISNSIAGNGGAGSGNWSTWLTSIGIGSSGFIAGGGGGGIYNPGGTAGTATAGGGNGSATGYGTAGKANTGGGGGGAVGGSTTNYTGGNGGSGLIIVRYAR